MMTEDDFLANIAANPADEFPRLMFSDWLNDRGDPRWFWVRDAELFAWMGPNVEDPIPRLIAALKDTRAHKDDRDRELEEEAKLSNLPPRAGEGVIPPLLSEFGLNALPADTLR